MNVKRKTSDLSASFGPRNTCAALLLWLWMRFCVRRYAPQPRPKNGKLMQWLKTTRKGERKKKRARTQETQHSEFIHSSSGVYWHRLFHPQAAGIIFSYLNAHYEHGVRYYSFAEKFYSDRLHGERTRDNVAMAKPAKTHSEQLAINRIIFVRNSRPRARIHIFGLCRYCSCVCLEGFSSFVLPFCSSFSRVFFAFTSMSRSKLAAQWLIATDSNECGKLGWTLSIFCDRTIPIVSLELH